MIASIIPDIVVSSDECQAISGEIEAAVVVVEEEVRCAGNDFIVALGECLGASLLGVIHLKD